MVTLLDFFNNTDKMNNLSMTFIEGSVNENRLSYKELRTKAFKVLGFLQHSGVKPKDELVFQIEDNEIFIITFWACIIGGIIPIPLTVGRTEDHFKKLFNVWGILKNPHLIVSSEHLSKINSLAEIFNAEELFNDIKKNVIDEDRIFSLDQVGEPTKVDKSDIAYIQFSSGSTGNPKGVTLTHENLVTNVIGILNGIKSPEQGDTFFSWMPLTHDMGLIGFHLTPFLAGWDHFIMSTSLFIRRPLLWLEKISEHKISFTASPNFGYSYLIRRFNANSLVDLDLSSLRIIVNGAEPISASLCEDFYTVFSKYGLKENVIFPVYGLAEASLAVTFTDPSDRVQSILVDRSKLGIGMQVSILEKGDGLSLVNVGKDIKGCSVQIVDNNKLLEEGKVGEIQIKGNNVTNEYYGNKEETSKTITSDHWLNTGDLGFIHDGNLYISGRVKDVIFVNGQNYYSHDLEGILEHVEGVELGKVIASSCTNTDGKSEVLIFVYFKKKLDKFITIVSEIKKRINDVFGFEPSHIIPVNNIPKTTSGKVQRYKLVEQYINSEFLDMISEMNSLMANQVSEVTYEKSENDIERVVAQIWKEVLGHQNFGVTDRFFEIGGNSLKGAQVLNAIQKEFNVDLEYHKIYEKQTIKEITTEVLADQSETSFKLIQVTNNDDLHPLTLIQERLYYFWKLNPSSVAYNVPVAIQFNGVLDIELLEESINKLVSRHDVLKAFFSLSKGELRQNFNKDLHIALHVTTVNNEELDFELQQRVLPFDLSKSPLLRVEILKILEKNHILFIDVPHIIADGISINIFLEELIKIYDGATLQEQEIQYKDFVYWKNDFLETEITTKQKQYWSHRLKSDIPVLDLQTDYNRPALFDYKGGKLHFLIDHHLNGKLLEIAKNENISLQIVLLTIYNILLSKYSGKEDIVLGIPVSGREHYQLQGLVGMFVNNLVLRNTPTGDLRFIDFLKEVKTNTFNDYNNQNYPFSKLVEDFNIRRDASRHPFFDTMFVYQNMDAPKSKNESLTASHYFFDPGVAKYDLTLEVIEETNALNYYFEYAKDIFDEETIKRLIKHFRLLIEQIVSKPEVLISELVLLSKDELQENLVEFNNTDRTYNKENLIYELFEFQVEANPSHVAIRRNNEAYISYKELDDKATLLSETLKEKGVSKNTSVAVCLDRNIELIISILGILKAGGCFLPIDKNIPQERVDFILKDSNTNYIISNESFMTSLRNKKVPDTEFYDILEDCLLMIDSSNNNHDKKDNINEPDQLAYIIYTSGSTGNPKGVKVSHQSLLNYLSWAKRIYLSEDKCALPLYTSISFDLTLTSIFLPLITGNTVVVYPENEDYLAIEQVLLENQVEVVKVTPSHLKIINESLLFKDKEFKSRIKTFIVGGEALTTKLAKDIHSLFDGDIEIYNEYGPTEATIGCVVHRYDIDADTNIYVPIGTPIDNTKTYLLDAYLKPVGEGLVGELYIAGECLSKGYLNRLELTNEKFVTNPFVENKLMYKSGDLVKRIDDGNLNFIGRTDDQVKVNGHRIELGEIENKLLEYELIKEAIVVFKDKVSLNAYVIKNASSSNNFDKEIKAFMRKSLPDYMVPRHIIEIATIPVTINGKVDHSLLPDPLIGNDRIVVASNNEVEETILNVWRKVLSTNEIGIQSNFYEEGGDSIKAIQIASRLFEQNIKVKAKDVLTYSTVEQLMNHVELIDESFEYVQVSDYEEIALNPIQSWFIGQKLNNINLYNQSVLLKFSEPLNEEDINETFKEIIRHHDTFRLKYNMDKNIMHYDKLNHDVSKFLEVYEIENHFIFEAHDVRDSENTTTVLSNEILNIFTTIRNSFDISKSLLLKAASIKTADANLLFITAHHLIIDGISWRVFLEDFYKIYNAIRQKQEFILPKKTASLIDYNKIMIAQSNTIDDKEISFWKEMEGSEFRIPYYSDDETYIANDIGKISIELNKEDTDFLLKDAHKAYKTNVEILLMASLTKTLNEWLESDDVVVEMENHGRHFESLNISRTIGWFTSLYPVRFRLENNELGGLIKTVKERIKNIPNGGVNYGILKYINGSLEIDKRPPDVRFNYLGQFESEVDNDTFSIINKDLGLENDPNNNVDVKIEINAMILQGKLQVKIHYLQNDIIDGFINGFAIEFKENVMAILDYIRGEDDIHFTSSDFDAVHLDSEDLKVLFD